VLLGAEDSRPAATVSIGGGDPAAAWTLDVHQNQQIMQPWLQGLNPILGEQSPARLLRDGELEQDGPRLLDAARAFAADA